MMRAAPPRRDIVSFAITATPDGGFNVLTLGAVLFILVDAALLLASLVLLLIGPTRPLSVGFLTGNGLVAAVFVILSTMFVGVASVAA